jgi:hypothetical protein
VTFGLDQAKPLLVDVFDSSSAALASSSSSGSETTHKPALVGDLKRQILQSQERGSEQGRSFKLYVDTVEDELPGDLPLSRLAEMLSGKLRWYLRSPQFHPLKSVLREHILSVRLEGVYCRKLLLAIFQNLGDGARTS